MKKRDIEASLRRAGDELPRADFAKAAGEPVQRMEVHDYATMQPPAPPRSKRPLLLAALLVLLAAGLVLALWTVRGGGLTGPYSVLYMDVNPSFSIALDREDEVLSVQAGNSEAEALLEGRSYRGWDLDAALVSLLDSLESAGYSTSDVSFRAESRSDDRARLLELEAGLLLEARRPSTIPASTPMPTTPPGRVPEQVTPQPSPDLPPAVPLATPSPGHHGYGYGADWSGVTAGEAEDAVLELQPDAVIRDTELDEDDGYYEIEFDLYGSKYKATVDADEGNVLTWKQDD